MMFTISVYLPPAMAQWVTSLCQHSLGSSASNLMNEDRGLFWGWGTMQPRRRRIRWMVLAEGEAP